MVQAQKQTCRLCSLVEQSQDPCMCAHISSHFVLDRDNRNTLWRNENMELGKLEVHMWMNSSHLPQKLTSMESETSMWNLNCPELLKENKAMPHLVQVKERTSNWTLSAEELGQKVDKQDFIKQKHSFCAQLRATKHVKRREEICQLHIQQRTNT